MDACHNFAYTVLTADMASDRSRFQILHDGAIGDLRSNDNNNNENLV